MTTAELLSAEQAKQDYPLLRREAGMVLNPPSGHLLDYVPLERWEWVCKKCGVRYHGDVSCSPHRSVGTNCAIPDPATESLPEIAENLLRMVLKQPNWRYTLPGVINSYRPLGLESEGTRYDDTFDSWIIISPAERAACCLAALREKESK